MRTVRALKVDIRGPVLGWIENEPWWNTAWPLPGALSVDRAHVHGAWWHGILFTTAIAHSIELSPGTCNFLTSFIATIRHWWSPLKSRWTNPLLESLLRRYLLYLYCKHLILPSNTTRRRSHASSRSRSTRHLCQTAAAVDSSVVAILVDLVVIYH